MKERLTKTGYIAIGCAVLLIAGFAWTSIARSSQKHGTIQPVSATTTLMKVSDFPGVTATSTDTVHAMLADSFQKGALHEIAVFEVSSSTGDQLVLAAPGMDGAQNEYRCGLQDNPLCGLYIRTKQGNTRLLIWGSRLTGLNNVEGFPDSKHAILSMMWNLYGFTSIDREQLDLEDGTLIPLLSVEQDKSDTTVDVRVSGFGDIVTLHIEGKRFNGMILPAEILIQNQAGQTVFTLDPKATERLAEIVQDAYAQKEQVENVLVTPTDQDIQTKTLPIFLYGEPWKFDVSQKTLMPLDSRTE